MLVISTEVDDTSLCRLDLLHLKDYNCGVLDLFGCIRC